MPLLFPSGFKMHNQTALSLSNPTIIGLPFSLLFFQSFWYLGKYHHGFHYAFPFPNVLSLCCMLKLVGKSERSLPFSRLFFTQWCMHNCITTPGLWSTICVLTCPNNLCWSWALGKGVFLSNKFNLHTHLFKGLRYWCLKPVVIQFSFLSSHIFRAFLGTGGGCLNKIAA